MALVQGELAGILIVLTAIMLIIVSIANRRK
jgi:hypothetical protein